MLPKIKNLFGVWEKYIGRLKWDHDQKSNFGYFEIAETVCKFTFCELWIVIHREPKHDPSAARARGKVLKKRMEGGF